MTDREIEKAKTVAKTDAKLLAILLLTSLESKTNPDQVEWRADLGRFYFRGRSVSPELIRNYLDRIETKLGRRLAKLTADLESGKITEAQWHREFEKTITSSHVIAAALALGGIAAALGSQLVQDRIDAEIAFSDDFANEIVKKKAGSFQRISARAKSYLAASRITFAQAEQKAREVVGIQTECIRVLRAKESCTSCLYWNEKGWVEIALQPPIGNDYFPCTIYCRCFLIYR